MSTVKTETDFATASGAAASGVSCLVALGAEAPKELRKFWNWALYCSNGDSAAAARSGKARIVVADTRMLSVVVWLKGVVSCLRQVSRLSVQATGCWVCGSWREGKRRELTGVQETGQTEMTPITHAAGGQGRDDERDGGLREGEEKYYL